MVFPDLPAVSLPDPSSLEFGDTTTLQDIFDQVLDPYRLEIEGLRTKVGYDATVETALDYLVARSREQVWPYSRSGDLVVGASSGAPPAPFPWAVTLLGVRASLGTAGTSVTTLDVNRNGGTNSGTTVFTTQASRPGVAANQVLGAEVVPNVTALAAGEYLTIDRDVVGTGAKDLLVLVRLRRT